VTNNNYACQLQLTTICKVTTHTTNISYDDGYLLMRLPKIHGCVTKYTMNVPPTEIHNYHASDATTLTCRRHMTYPSSITAPSTSMQLAPAPSSSSAPMLSHGLQCSRCRRCGIVVVVVVISRLARLLMTLLLLLQSLHGLHRSRDVVVVVVFARTGLVSVLVGCVFSKCSSSANSKGPSCFA
jgi:hypothetical protein